MTAHKSNVPGTAQCVKGTNRPRVPWPLVLIVGTVTLVMLLGYVLSPRTEEARGAWVDRLGTTNLGILLNPPVQVASGQIVDSSGHGWSGLEDSTWKLLVFSPGGCQDACLQRVVEIKALRARLNRNAGRLSLGIITATDGVVAVHELDQAVQELHIQDPQLLLALRSTNIPDVQSAPAVLLMTPVNVFMMAYGQGNSGSDILADLEHLLRLAH